GVEPPRQHPFGLALLRRNEPDGVFAKALRGLLRFNQRLESILILIDVDTADLIDGLLHCRHSSLRSRFQGPRVGFVGYGPVPASGLSVPGDPPKRHRSPWGTKRRREIGRARNWLGRHAALLLRTLR